MRPSRRRTACASSGWGTFLYAIHSIRHPEERSGRSSGASRRTHDVVAAPLCGMKFGEVPVGEAEGAILAHSLKLGARALKKGRLLSRADLDAIAAAGLAHIVVARLEPGDLREDEAAARIAAAAAGENIAAANAFTGRANLFAEARGLLVFERDRLDRLNLVDESVTLGTRPPYAVVEPRQMVATAKIIPFAVPEPAVEAAVLGLPGCARSPKVNGFDWVLERLVAGVPVGAREIMRMGAGGLLAEIPSRPLPRAEASPAPEEKVVQRKPAPGPRIAALLLAA